MSIVESRGWGQRHDFKLSHEKPTDDFLYFQSADFPKEKRTYRFYTNSTSPLHSRDPLPPLPIASSPVKIVLPATNRWILQLVFEVRLPQISQTPAVIRRRNRHRPPRLLLHRGAKMFLGLDGPAHSELAISMECLIESPVATEGP